MTDIVNILYNRHRLRRGIIIDLIIGVTSGMAPHRHWSGYKVSGFTKVQ